MPPALHGDYAIYEYTPSIVGAVIFVILFAVMTTAHSWRLLTSKTYFCIPFAIGGIFELVGYAGRCASHYDPPALIPYIIQSILLLVAPALFAATIYMLLGRMIRRVNAEDLSIIPTKWLTTLFVIGDVLSFFVQAGGAGIMIKGATSMNTGKNIILVGLFIQIAMFAFFLVVAGLFGKRMAKREQGRRTQAAVPWTAMLRMLFGVSSLILLRNVFRVVEYAMGQTGYLLANEWPLYIFDAVPMLGVMVGLLFWYPSRIYNSSAGAADVEMENGDQLVLVEQPGPAKA